MDDNAEIDYKSVESNLKSKVRLEALKECVKMSFKNPKTLRIPDESLQLLNEVVQKLVLEAALRGAKQALCDHQTRIEMEQIEKILPQLLLDFP